VANFATNTLKAKTVAILFDNANDYSKGLKTNFEATFTADGGQVVSESYATGDKDFNAQIAKLKAAKPDALFLPDYYSAVSLIAKQIRAAGITAPLLGADGWDDAVGTDNADLVGAYYSNHFSKESASDVAKAYMAAYNTKYGYDTDALAALGYDATKILLGAVAAADKAGKLTSEEIRNQLAATKGTFVTGDISFDANRNTVKSAVIVQIEAGADKKLATKFVATVNP
jgi:branched-chain amino acid transport system substrate-binding protein